MDPITILSAFAPVVVDLGKSLINKFIAPDNFKPATIGGTLEFFRSSGSASIDLVINQVVRSA